MHLILARCAQQVAYRCHWCQQRNDDDSHAHSDRTVWESCRSHRVDAFFFVLHSPFQPRIEHWFRVHFLSFYTNYSMYSIAMGTAMKSFRNYFPLAGRRANIFSRASELCAHGNGFGEWTIRAWTHGFLLIFHCSRSKSSFNRSQILSKFFSLIFVSFFFN